MTPKERTGQICRDRRSALRLSLRELHDRTGIHISMLSRMENGADISLDTFRKLNAVLRFSFDEVAEVVAAYGDAYAPTQETSR